MKPPKLGNTGLLGAMERKTGLGTVNHLQSTSHSMRFDSRLSVYSTDSRVKVTVVPISAEAGGQATSEGYLGDRQAIQFQVKGLPSLVVAKNGRAVESPSAGPKAILDRIRSLDTSSSAKPDYKKLRQMAVEAGLDPSPFSDAEVLEMAKKFGVAIPYEGDSENAKEPPGRPATVIKGQSLYSVDKTARKKIVDAWDQRKKSPELAKSLKTGVYSGRCSLYNGRRAMNFEFDSTLKVSVGPKHPVDDPRICVTLNYVYVETQSWAGKYEICNLRKRADGEFGIDSLDAFTRGGDPRRYFAMREGDGNPVVMWLYHHEQRRDTPFQEDFICFYDSFN